MNFCQWLNQHVLKGERVSEENLKIMPARCLKPPQPEAKHWLLVTHN